MNPTEERLLSDMVPVAAWALNMACPAVPAFVWATLIGAVLNGDITVDHIEQFLKDHNIKSYSENNQLNPALSAYPGEVKNGGV